MEQRIYSSRRAEVYDLYWAREKRSGWVIRRLTYWRRLSTLMLDLRNLANFMYRQDKAAIDALVVWFFTYRYKWVVSGHLIFPDAKVHLLAGVVYHIGVSSVRCWFNGTGQMREPRRWNNNERFTLFCVYMQKSNMTARLRNRSK